MSNFFFKPNRVKHLCCPPPIDKMYINSPLLIYRFPCKIKLAIKINSSLGSNNHNQCYTVANQTLNAYGKWAGCPGGSGPGYSSTMRYNPGEISSGVNPRYGGSVCNCAYSAPVTTQTVITPIQPTPAESTPIPPSIGAFTFIARNFGEAQFNIISPTSNSNGSFSYTSSNTAVATVTSGGTVTIVSVGSSTITATQAASGNYTSGSVNATFTVSDVSIQPPTNLTTQPGSERITLTFTPPSRNDIQVFVISYRTPPNSGAGWIQYNLGSDYRDLVQNPRNITDVITNLSSSTTYEIRVATVTSQGTSAFSNSVTGNTF